MFYATENQVSDIVRAFENGAIKREDWRHAEHFTVAFYYASHHDFDAALTKMRAGIFRLLECFQIDLAKEMPYHETLTVFWMQRIFDLLEMETGGFSIKSANKILAACADKDLPLQHYSRERLFSDDAREKFVAPDLHLQNRI